MPSLLLGDGSEITNCFLILEQQELFYKYESIHTIPLEGSEYYDHFSEIPTFNKDQQMALDNSIPIEKTEYAIKNSKLNKAPGPDEFNKWVLYNELKFWLLRVFNESLSAGSLPCTMLEGIITCIPKAGKFYNSLKNWRPLTLLNSSNNFSWYSR